jgi:hypothetical protein
MHRQKSDLISLLTKIIGDHREQSDLISLLTKIIGDAQTAKRSHKSHKPQKLRARHRQQGDLISLGLFFKINKIGLKGV